MCLEDKMSARCVFLLFPVFLSLNALTTSKSYGTIYSGHLDYAPSSGSSGSDIQVAGDKWPKFNITLSWIVTDEEAGPTGFPWKYTYTFTTTGNGAAASHVILETSSTFRSNDIKDLTGANMENVELQKVSSGNPNMPGDVYGIRFVPSTGSTNNMTWTFWSDRIPVWGDFYAKGGNDNTAYNHTTTSTGEKGFTTHDTDPTEPAANGSLNCHILRPDTVTVIPEPATIVLILFSSGLILKRRRA
jgi:hypothetical protein